jgi:hypothetical protein
MWDILLEWFGSHLWEPHGHCFLWTPSLLWPLVGVNLLIALAYCNYTPLNAKGYVMKNERPEALLVSIRAILANTPNR